MLCVLLIKIVFVLCVKCVVKERRKKYFYEYLHKLYFSSSMEFLVKGQVKSSCQKSSKKMPNILYFKYEATYYTSASHLEYKENKHTFLFSTLIIFSVNI